MSFRGIYKTSLIDFPGKISTVLFTGGCNLRCRYCHNPDLALNSKDLPEYTESWILDEFLPSRKGLVDGVAITGGEPTLYPHLDSFLEKVRDRDLLVKLDTNGFRPNVIQDLVDKGLVDYLAMDIKTSPSRYPELTQRDISFNTLLETLDIMRNSGVSYELRTTCVPEYITAEAFHEIGEAIGHVSQYYLQQFVGDVDMVDQSFQGTQPYPVKVLVEFREIVSTFADVTDIRGI